MISIQGIFKPKVLPEIPISITTTKKGPYKDRMSPEGHIVYSYRGTNPQHPDNAGLRKAWKRVLEAYHNQCAMCHLRHVELLDAAHIIPDGEPGGEPVVSNGISLCKLHHAAFDNFFLGVRPDFVIEIKKDILDEEDGPMLMHGLKGLHGNHLWIPRSPEVKPSVANLKIRYERFIAG